MKNIGIDIGGTFIKAAIVENTGKIILSSKTPTPKTGDAIPGKTAEIIDDLLVRTGITADEISHIGIGVPGLCDCKNGVIVSCTNIEGCENIRICDYMREKFKVEAYLDNDANCAALGEYLVSEVKPESFVFVTLGTGVGGGIIINGRLVRGINSAAGEVGHIVLVKNGERCNCGRRGCWERYASVTALVRRAKAHGFTGNVSGRSIFADKYKGNKRADEVISGWLEHVAEGICDLVNIFQPEELVIGGGISREGDVILNPIRKFVEKNSIDDSRCQKKTDIKISRLFNDAGVVGASFLYTQN